MMKSGIIMTKGNPTSTSVNRFADKALGVTRANYRKQELELRKSTIKMENITNQKMNFKGFLYKLRDTAHNTRSKS